jgi:hypothetical protein
MRYPHTYALLKAIGLFCLIYSLLRLFAFTLSR